jgi:hypothetical protein
MSGVIEKKNIIDAIIIQENAKYALDFNLMKLTEKMHGSRATIVDAYRNGHFLFKARKFLFPECDYQALYEELAKEDYANTREEEKTNFFYRAWNIYYRCDILANKEYKRLVNYFEYDEEEDADSVDKYDDDDDEIMDEDKDEDEDKDKDGTNAEK